MLGLALTLLLTQNPATMAGGRAGGILTPPPFFTAFTTVPATECSGAAVTSVEGTSISFTNAATTRYCEKSDGTLVAMTANQPRVTNDGLLIEGSRTNLVIRSTALDNAAWTASGVTVSANTAVAPDGTTTAEELTDVSGSNTGTLTSTAFVPGQSTLTASIFNGSGNPFTLAIRDTTAGATRATCSLNQSAFSRDFCNATGLTGANNHVLILTPDPTGLGTPMNFWGAMAEAPLANDATSFIPTVATSVLRNNDTATWSNSTDISTRGCLAATVKFGQAGQLTGTILANGTEKMMGVGSATTITANDGTNTVTATVASLVGRTVSIIVSWSGSTLTVRDVTDSVTASGSFDGSFSSTATMRIGATSAASSYANAYISNIKAGADPASCN